MPKRQESQLANESAKTLKTREKLKKKLASIDRSITQQGLKQKMAEIQRWISRNAADRVPLRVKSIALFDKNQNTATVSAKIVKLTASLQNKLAVGDVAREHH